MVIPIAMYSDKMYFNVLILVVDMLIDWWSIEKSIDFFNFVKKMKRTGKMCPLGFNYILVFPFCERILPRVEPWGQKRLAMCKSI